MEKTRKVSELLDDLIKAIKNDMSSGPVCDSSFKCKGWEEGMKQIDAAINFCFHHLAGPIYTAPSFKYCPWCGKEIKEKPA